MSEARGFPAGFLWGAAASSYQIEGACAPGERGDCVWDVLCRTPGAIGGGDDASTACDHLNRYREDVDLMAGMGLQAYRLSLCWPRIFTEGTGQVHATGLDFYQRLVDNLLERGIQPWITLFHWDYPTALYRRGGWLNPDSPTWFADYAAAACEALSDRVRHWMTFNEPQCFIFKGHGAGVHAPGLRLPREQVLLAAHHYLLAHGKAVQAMRAKAKQPLSIGIAPVGVAAHPATGSGADARAAMAFMGACSDDTLWNNTWWLDPVFLGRYPKDGLEIYARDLPRIGQDDMQTICQPLDFAGVNIYHSYRIRKGEGGRAVQSGFPPGHPRTAFNWPVTPEALYWGPKFFAERYGLPVYITENGLSNCDWVDAGGRVRDPQRIDFTARYLRELYRLVQEGVDVRGYFHWSILDNFEWAQGYNERFGLIHVDFATQKRTPKDSANWYAEVIRTNGRTALAIQGVEGAPAPAV